MRRCRPVLYLSPEGSWHEILPEAELVCTDRMLRGWERNLRMRIHQHEHFADDIPVEAIFEVTKVVGDTGWGLQPRRIDSSEARGAWTFDPVIHSAADVAKLRCPTVTHDEQESQRRFEAAQNAFGDLLEVRLVGFKHNSFHLIKELTALRGLDQTFMDMHDDPGLLHACLEIFTEGHLSLTEQRLAAGLLEHNQDGAYQNSGGRSWTDDLPRPGADPQRPRLCDLWASAEAQELTAVGPEHHREFALQYERRLLAPFGLTGYGCCENLTDKLDDVLSLPNIRRISCSPWADVPRFAEALGRRAIVSWKPHPAHLATEWREDRIRAYLRAAIETCKVADAQLEIILKDTHTCMNHPERFDRWAAIAREEIIAAGHDTLRWPFSAVHSSISHTPA